MLFYVLSFLFGCGLGYLIAYLKTGRVITALASILLICALIGFYGVGLGFTITLTEYRFNVYRFTVDLLTVVLTLLGYALTYTTTILRRAHTTTIPEPKTSPHE